MPWRQHLRGNLPVLILGFAVLASSALLLALGSGIAFFQDSWAFLLTRQGGSLEVFLNPHNEHIVVIPVAIQKGLVAVFGAGSAVPERVALTLAAALTAVLVFVYARRRLGDWLALIAVIPLLLLGPAWEALIWPFEIALVGSLAAGVAALLALERDDGPGDVAACLLLCVSVGFASLGVAFAVGALVDVLLRRRDRGLLRRLYVAAIPLLLYGAWYAAYGSEAQSTATLRNAVEAPITVVGGFSASAAAIFGLFPLGAEIGGHGRAFLGLIALALLVAIVVYLHRRRPGVFETWREPGVSPRLWPILTTALAFWLLAGLADRGIEASRYMGIGAVFVLLIGADLLRGARLGRTALVAVAAVALIATAANLIPLFEGRDHLREESVLTRADLGALEIARGTVEPAFWLAPEVSGTLALINVVAGPYFELVDDSGSPAYTPAELERAPLAGRRQADIVLAAALPVTLAEDHPLIPPSSLIPRNRCVELIGGTASQLPFGASHVRVGPGDAADLRIGRFAPGFPVELGEVPGGSAALIDVPRDRSSRPWRLRVEGARKARLCPVPELVPAS